jgi:hypothetical protein
MPQERRILMVSKAKNLIGVAAIVLLACSTASSTHESGREPSAFDPLVSLHGARSSVAKLRYERITTKKDWDKLWSEHTAGSGAKNHVVHSSTPTIDFKRCMVVAVFSGPAWNCDGHYVKSTSDEGSFLRMRFDSYTYQTAGPDGGGQRVRPFGIWVLPRSVKAIILEENTQGLIGKPPIWKERKRWPAL